MNISDITYHMAAFTCMNQAKKLATMEWNKYPDGYPCDCHNGQMTVTIETQGSDPMDPPKKISMECPRCKGTEKMTFSGLLQRYVWCKCQKQKYEYNCVYAPDGRQVFGNDTYICRQCGMVTQFG